MLRPIDQTGVVADLDSRRKLKAVHSLHTLTLTPQHTLDDICEVLTRSIRCDFAVVVRSDERSYHVIGAHGVSVRHYASDLLSEEWPEDGLVELHQADQSDWGPRHPMVNGQVERMVSTLYASLRYDGQVVGLIGVGTRERLDAYTVTERNILLRLRRVTESLIRAEATLSRLAAEAFRALERIRREGLE